jgi:hypothetical protein
MQAQTRTISLISRVIFAILIAGLLPLIGITVSAIRGFRTASSHAAVASSDALDEASLTPLRQRAEQTAREIGDFLDVRADDTRAAALLPPQLTAYTQFMATRDNPIWYVTGTTAAPVEQRQQFPIFRELVSVDGAGRQIAHVVDGKPVSDPGDPVSIAGYLAEARGLAPGALSVSHLSRRYAPRPADDATRLPGADYVAFSGVYRFIAARHTADGAFDGAVMLALDARHIMEFVVHIVPTPSEHSAVWADFGGGNYASLYDDEGWAVARPHLWDVRGDDANGQPVPAATEQMSSAERDSHPFNARLGTWADPDLPMIFEQGKAKAGVVISDDPRDPHRVTTYAPVPFDEGSYHDRGVFGVLTIGANTSEFHQAATTVTAVIDKERNRLELEIALLGLLGLGILALTGVAVGRMLVRPLARLTVVARRLEGGEFDEEQLAPIRQRRFSDEVTVLANVFAEMGHMVMHRERELRTEMANLHIQIDNRRRQMQVDEITETDYFRNLRDTATRLRSRGTDEPPPEGNSE